VRIDILTDRLRLIDVSLRMRSLGVAFVYCHLKL